MSLSVTVVICAYTDERWDQLVAAIDSVRQQQTGAQEIILVVDHNADLLKKARSHLPLVHVVPNTGEKGLSGARNTGVALAAGDVVVFLDDDAVAAVDWIEQLLTSYDDPSVMGVGGSASPVWETAAPRWWPEEFLWVVGCTYRGQPSSRAPVRNLMGCNMSFRRTILQLTGGFDEGLGRTADAPLGCEETELCIRATKMFPGSVLIYEPRARVHHAVPARRATWSYYRNRCRAEGLSKARVAGLVGQTASLAEERKYTRRVLPAGVLRNVGELLAGDASGAGRAGAIVAGLSLTATNYVAGRVATVRRERKSA